MKKIIVVMIIAILTMSTLAGCGKGEDTKESFDKANSVNVVSREPGSGTRGAFVELTGVEDVAKDGSKTDLTTEDAIISNKTDVMLTNVAGDLYSIGYVSSTSLNDSVKALKVDGVEVTPETIKDGTYKISRPFNIVTKGEAKGLTKDFIDYILSSEGQKVVSEEGVPIDDKAPTFESKKPEGKITVAGSSSVTPVMELLIEAYKGVNPNATIELQQSDSTTGITSTIDGTCEIGMASRDLKDEEKSKVKDTKIALDGIAVIVNKDNPIEDISLSQIKDIFTGKTKEWTEVIK